jgi:hypothetical protein
MNVKLFTITRNLQRLVMVKNSEFCRSKIYGRLKIRPLHENSASVTGSDIIGKSGSARSNLTVI